MQFSASRLQMMQMGQPPQMQNLPNQARKTLKFVPKKSLPKFQAGRCLGYSIGTSWNINLIYTTGFTSNGHRWSNDVEHFAGAMNVAPVDRWSLSNRKIRLSGIGILVVCEDVFPALRKILQCCLIALFARRHGESRPGWWQICSEFSVAPAGSTLVSFQAARPWRIYLQ